MDERIRALIVDDERSSRRAIAVQLEAMDAVEVVGEAANGRAAVELTRKTRPDLVFLDVQMPGMDGFGVIEELGPNALPHIVFVTAHDEFALKAFEVNAVDYLLKPVDDRRLTRAVDRVRRQAADPERALGDSGVRRLLEHTVGGRPPGPHKARLLVKQQQAYVFVPVEAIEWIEAEGNYARLHADGGDYLVRSSLTDLDEDLDPSVFLRIHRSAIVNLNRVRSIQPHGSDYQVVLASGRHVRVGRTYRDALLQRE